jgi:hypothetical protein
MDYKSLVNEYKQLFLKYSGGKPIDLPPDEFLEVAAKMEVNLGEKGQEVKKVVGGGNLYLSADPSGIGIGVSPESAFPDHPGMLWAWFKPEKFEHFEQRSVWTGEWSRWIGEIMEYKGQIEVYFGNIAEFNPEGTVDKLFQVSAKFMGSFPEVKVALDKLEASREELYSNAKDELAKILA